MKLKYDISYSVELYPYSSGHISTIVWYSAEYGQSELVRSQQHSQHAEIRKWENVTQQKGRRHSQTAIMAAVTEWRFSLSLTKRKTRNSCLVEGCNKIGQVLYDHQIHVHQIRVYLTESVYLTY